MAASSVSGALRTLLPGIAIPAPRGIRNAAWAAVSMTGRWAMSSLADSVDPQSGGRATGFPIGAGEERLARLDLRGPFLCSVRDEVVEVPCGWGIHERPIERAQSDRLCESYRFRTIARDDLRHTRCFGHQLVKWHDAIDEANAKRFFSGHALPRQEHPHRDFQRYLAPDPQRPAGTWNRAGVAHFG